MIRIYESNTTDFSNFGLALINPLKASVKEKVNGLYSLTFSLPLEESEEIEEDRIVKTNDQYYRILRINKFGNQKEYLNVYCENLFQVDLIDDFSLSFIYSDVSVEYALQQLVAGTIFQVGQCDDLGLNSIADTQKSKAELLKQILSIWQGELYIDGLVVGIKSSIGEYTGVRIQQGKNLKAIEVAEDISNVVTRLHYANTKENLAGTVDSPYISDYAKIKNYYKQFEAETQTELDSMAQNWLEQNDKPYLSYSIDLIELAYTEEFKGFEELEKVNLGDVTDIKHNKLSVDIQARVLEKSSDLEFDGMETKLRNTKVVIGNYREDYFNFQVSLEDTKSTVNYAFSERRLNSATLKGLKVVDETRDIISFEVTEDGKINIDAKVNMTSDSTLQWDNITDGDTRATQITRDTVETENLIAENLQVNSANINGILTAGQITTDIGQVNDTLYVGGPLEDGTIVIGGGIDDGYISYSSDSIVLGAFNGVSVNGSGFIIETDFVDFGNSTIYGLDCLTEAQADDIYVKPFFSGNLGYMDVNTDSVVFRDASGNVVGTIDFSTGQIF